MIPLSSWSDPDATRDERDRLIAEHVTLTVKGHPVLRDVSVSLEPRTVTCLVGPSGSGKSSLLKVLNRMWDRVPGVRIRGSVRFGSVDLYARRTDPTWVRSRIGMVFQRPLPFPRSIVENIALPLRIAGTPRREIPERVEAALQMAALWDEVKDRLHQSALTLSGGQQQRLTIARALAVHPDVLLMDEPASALDPRAREAIGELIRRVSEHVTILLVTHSLDEARALSTRLGVLIDGALAAFGPTEAIFQHAEPAAVRAYLGGVGSGSS
jgi:phosphate transport system ATP-binding protein